MMLISVTGTLLAGEIGMCTGRNLNDVVFLWVARHRHIRHGLKLLS